MVNGNLVYTAVVPELQLAASRVCINDNISYPLNKNPQVCEFSFSVRLHSVVEEDVSHFNPSLLSLWEIRLVICMAAKAVIQL